MDRRDCIAIPPIANFAQLTFGQGWLLCRQDLNLQSLNDSVVHFFAAPLLLEMGFPFQREESYRHWTCILQTFYCFVYIHCLVR